MITADGYSKDPSIIPEGIAVTFGEGLIQWHGSVKQLLKEFEWCMQQDEGVWYQKCRNRPGYEHELLYVYIIICGRLYGRCMYIAHEKEPTDIFPWPRILLSGPLVKCPSKRKLKGFRNFRYTTKLF
jgi:hypothetical protein